MNIWNSIVLGLKEIWAHKLRSLLTMFGIVLGVSSLVTTAAIVEGMQKDLREPLLLLGGLDKVLITNKSLPPHQAHLQDQAPGLTLKDAHALANGAPLLRVVSPLLHSGWTPVSRNGKQTVPSGFQGVWPSVLEIRSHQLEHGRIFTDLDDKNRHRVCVIGTGIRDALFGTPEDMGRTIVPLGEQVYIRGEPYTIVGMFKHYERESTRVARERAAKNGKTFRAQRPSRWEPFWRKNNVVYVPLNTHWEKFRSALVTGSPDPKLHNIGIKVTDVDQFELALQQVRNVLMRTHHGMEDFRFSSYPGRLQDGVDKRVRDARISGGMISGLSLLVGGIGIMNIMLASINERIREIGTCKAIGATGVAIFLQVLVEGLVLALLGALVGLAASFALVDLLEWASGGQMGAAAGNYSRSSATTIPVITAEAMWLALAFSGIVGAGASLFPALKAARLHPIEALRYQ
jgi:putative ABC transport system permease protein